jgi:16S rRNA (guanine527-N7)-methyltransferase
MEARPLSREEFAAELDVSRETLDRLAAYLDLLRRWQGTINLVGAATLHDPWRRHILDCAQLLAYLRSAPQTVVDLGSGAGLPGLVLAVLGVPGVHLIESDRRKAAFLREAARTTGAQVTIHACRVEQLEGCPANVVTARALAPLPRLVALAERFIGPDTVCLFLKGRSAPGELTEACKTWHMRPAMFRSRSDPSGVVLRLQGVARALDRES